ncbi:hypothetical protein BYT27DRAFT_6591326 [Phlegmacium glaucopus]|nr:hypothetical protein BYT27DRAFT_6591326 [Phlegmacium glaucopus]
MASRSSTNETAHPGALALSEFLKQGINRLSSGPPTAESGPPRSRETANAPIKSSHARPSISGSDIPSLFTSLHAPTIHPITHWQSPADQKQTPSWGGGLAHKPTTTQPLPAPVQTIGAWAGNFMKHHTKDWEPHVLSPTEIQHYREITHFMMKRIRDLEATQCRMIPKRSPLLEQTLFMARVEYSVRFGRIFRINHLPPEVLTNIFRYVAWSEAPESPELDIRRRLWLTWVCRHWREIAIMDPILWNAIWFDDLPNFERSLTWLERSADAPLDMRINDTKEKPISVPALQNLLKRLIDKISNIRIIIIVLQEWDPILVVLDAFRVVQKKGTPMILERFEMFRNGSPYVQIGTGYEPSYYLNPIPLFGGATVPSFNYLTLSGVHIDWTTSVLTNLTTLDIRRIPLDRSPTLSQFRALLGGSPALHKLFLDGAGPAWSDTIETRGLKPVHIPSLRILILGDFSVRYATYVCGQIFAPNVRDLMLMNFVGEDYSSLYDLLGSNMPKIKILALFSIDFVPGPRSSVSVIKWLHSMPLLTYFRIGNVRPQFLELFLYNCTTMRSLAEAQEPSGCIPCPKLAFFEVDGVQINVIARWARIRRQLGSPLQKLYLSADVAKQLGQYQQQQLVTAMGSVGTIRVLAWGNRPVEEEDLSREDIH